MNELPSELGTPLVSLDTPVVSKVVKNRFARVEQEDRGRLWLTPRDEALLTDLFLHQAMSRGQLQALHFGSTARCNARLRKLFDHGYVVRDFHPMAPYGTQGIYRIGPRAAKIVAQRTAAAALGVASAWPGPTFNTRPVAVSQARAPVRHGGQGGRGRGCRGGSGGVIRPAATAGTQGQGGQQQAGPGKREVHRSALKQSKAAV